VGSRGNDEVADDLLGALVRVGCASGVLRAWPARPVAGGPCAARGSRAKGSRKKSLPKWNVFEATLACSLSGTRAATGRPTDPRRLQCAPRPRNAPSLAGVPAPADLPHCCRRAARDDAEVAGDLRGAPAGLCGVPEVLRAWSALSDACGPWATRGGLERAGAGVEELPVVERLRGHAGTQRARPQGGDGAADGRTVSSPGGAVSPERAQPGRRLDPCGSSAPLSPDSQGGPGPGGGRRRRA